MRKMAPSAPPGLTSILPAVVKASYPGGLELGVNTYGPGISDRNFITPVMTRGNNEVMKKYWLCAN
jgi:hypothetical protein